MKKTTLFNFKSVIAALCILLSTGTPFSVAHAQQSDVEPDLRMKIRLEYNSPDSYSREILVIADETATDGVDEDFDVVMNNLQPDDMFWLIGSEKYSNQAISEINTETVIPVGITVNSSGMNSIAIDKLENIPENFKIFVHDITLGVYHEIKEGAYEVNLTSGVYLDRFEIVFTQPETLGVNSFELDKEDIIVFFDQNADEIKVINKNNLVIQGVDVYSILGQSVYRNQTTNTSNLNINVNQLTTGAYIVLVHTNTGKVSKKILIN
ncbi:T9SS type A sorting domain-containing protein [Psychroserpens sp.]|uniref:T9SS type A sorting domain-containing protein n=1 Tax=Psychroserpens sp. TaxID=2020870 RepID=UPI001B199FD4|nr:T9SS type A sorting domain-containing protein [Psychroserpens sp.]MBO6607026.1 T9SS type A sorting domain-containing protein [Psychroserpens sp.]MBO6631882.1 T9SS type A sorting domain-containing protein [Psychroserpens sp.]MBO6654172.1 T9SS type A sorting domain-containing protein [Psychroserpens sp.]MBO6682542.1 T9SS type A sorting domain-containing protein [Psychroserpens sp.]MBO6750798.1 T9SS type A sorting domain-containing protein [Psychroserpens sp.]